VFAQDSKIGLLLDALVDGDQLARRPVGHRSTVFLDYDGTLTPIVDRAEDALISVSGSVARHYRLIGKSERARIVGVVDAVLADHATELKVAPGKVVYEIQPGVDGDKGSAVRCLLEVVGLDGDEVVPLHGRHRRRTRLRRARLAQRRHARRRRRRPRAGRATHRRGGHAPLPGRG
jgi:hypothetical protein